MTHSSTCAINKNNAASNWANANRACTCGATPKEPKSALRKCKFDCAPCEKWNGQCDCAHCVPVKSALSKCCDNCKVHISCGIEAAVEDGFGYCTCKGNGCHDKKCPCHTPAEDKKEEWKRGNKMVSASKSEEPNGIYTVAPQKEKEWESKWKENYIRDWAGLAKKLSECADVMPKDLFAFQTRIYNAALDMAYACEERFDGIIKNKNKKHVSLLKEREEKARVAGLKDAVLVVEQFIPRLRANSEFALLADVVNEIKNLTSK